MRKLLPLISVYISASKIWLSHGPSSAGSRAPYDKRQKSIRNVLALGVLLAIGLGGCYPGVYPFDVFPEMHYQPSYRAYEPPRLSAPDSAVPITGRPAKLTDSAAARDLRNPIGPTREEAQRGEGLYRVNCLPCHGQQGRGDGLMAQYFQQAQLPTPADFTSSRTRARSDGELFFIITNGLGNMPPFGNLLSADERWRLVVFIRTVQAQQASN